MIALTIALSGLFSTSPALAGKIDVELCTASLTTGGTDRSDVFLTDQDYRWMLGQHYPLLEPSRAVIEHFSGEHGFAVDDQTVRSLFASAAADFPIATIEHYAVDDEDRHDPSGFVITFKTHPALKVGFQCLRSSSGEYMIPRMAIGYSPVEPDEDWFAREWYSRDSLYPFQTLFSADMEDWHQPGKLTPFGSHISSDGFVLDEFERDSAISKLDIVERSPDRKVLASDVNPLPNRTLIAVFDSGVDYNSPYLAGKLVGEGWNFVDGNNRPFDYGRTFFFGSGLSHGTAVAFVAAGDGDRVGVIPVRLIGEAEGQITERPDQQFARAVEFSRRAGAKIINMSYATYVEREKDVRKRARAMDLPPEMIDHAVSNTAEVRRMHEGMVKVMRANPDMLFVLAAGNEGEFSEAGLNADRGWRHPRAPSVDHFNASIHLPNVVRVASTQKDHTLSKFSVYGRRSIEVAAFGDLTELPFASGTLQESAGTSFAAPFFARVAGEVQHTNPDLKLNEVLKILRASVVKTIELKRKLIWGGYLDRSRALELAEKSLRHQRTAWFK